VVQCRYVSFEIESSTAFSILPSLLLFIQWLIIKVTILKRGKNEWMVEIMVARAAGENELEKI
jgi:hypothetical protein